MQGGIVEAGVATRALAILGGIAVLATGGCGGGPDDSVEGAGEGAGRPNVVVVMTDDQDAASVRSMPTVMRELAGAGVEFERSYVALSECCPSRVTYLTGQHAHNHGVETSKPPEGGYPALDSTSTLAVWLDEAGYRTGQVGRYVNFYGNSNVGTDPKEIPPGWDAWHVPVEHTEFQVYDYLLNEDGRLVSYGDAPSDYSTTVFARRAVEFIEGAAAADEPFFLSVTPVPPHSEGVVADDARRNPRPAPRDDGELEDVDLPTPPSVGEDLSDKPKPIRDATRFESAEEARRALEGVYRGRMESLGAIDRLVGDLIETLRATGELENTYILFTSDNGYMLGEHGLQGKHVVYEESVRVPLIIRGPGIEPGATRDELVQNVDLAPTIVELAGAAPDRELDGVSLLGELPDDRDLFLTYPTSKVAFDAVRSHGGHVYVEYADGSRELYDLEADPHQLDNLAGAPEHAELEASLAQRLDELRGCSGDGCR